MVLCFYSSFISKRGDETKCFRFLVVWNSWNIFHHLILDPCSWFSVRNYMNFVISRFIVWFWDVSPRRMLNVLSLEITFEMCLIYDFGNYIRLDTFLILLPSFSVAFIVFWEFVFNFRFSLFAQRYFIGKANSVFKALIVNY